MSARLSQVNTAARMETTSEPGMVQLSPSAAAILQKDKPPGLTLTSRGEIQIKGKVGHSLRACVFNETLCPVECVGGPLGVQRS